jgi:uncharacterized protein YfaS (alpha-2-macroglobulin family)
LVARTASYDPEYVYNQPVVLTVNRDGYGPYFAQVSSDFSYQDLQPDSKFWSTLSSDRPLYRLSDTLQYWGTLKHRDNERSASGTEVTLRLYRGYSYFFRGTSYYSPDKPLIETKVKVGKDGTFTGSIPFSGLSAEDYSVIAFVGDEVVSRTTFTVASFATRRIYYKFYFYSTSRYYY